MHSRSIAVFVSRWKLFPAKYIRYRLLTTTSRHGSDQVDGEEEEEEMLPSEWYEKAYPKLIKMAHALKHVDQIDGRVTNISDNSTITDDHIVRQMQTFKVIARAFIGSPTMQQALPRKQPPPSSYAPCFAKQQERTSTTLDSLTKVCNFLYISAQQRKSIRLTLCQQITQQHIWRGALEAMLENLRSEMDVLRHHISPASSRMGEQIVSACIKFLAETGGPSDHDSTPLWMQLSSSSPTTKKPAAHKHTPLRKWAEVAEMLGDLTDCLDKEERLAGHLLKVEAMKEGLYQIKDVVIDREIGYKEARRQDCLVQRKLSTSLGHSSKCLFTLLLYYLYGTVRDIEVDACGLYGSVTSGKGVLVCVGKVLTSDDERMVWRGVKQLDRALGVLRFVWETAKMKGVLELQGHLWCVGAKERSLAYRGTMFFIHAFWL